MNSSNSTHSKNSFLSCIFFQTSPFAQGQKRKENQTKKYQCITAKLELPVQHQ
jgi:hypothetical protein